MYFSLFLFACLLLTNLPAQDIILFGHVYKGSSSNGALIPIEGAQVGIAMDSVPEGTIASSDEEGYYELPFEWNWNGPIPIMCHAEGYEFYIIEIMPNFDTNSAVIMPGSESILNNAVKVLNDNASVHVRVEGHTDSRGSAAHNKGLSERRANSVVAYLVGEGINADRLSAIGYGEAAPVAPNDTPENMYKNRRVDLVVTKN